MIRTAPPQRSHRVTSRREATRRGYNSRTMIVGVVFFGFDSFLGSMQKLVEIIVARDEAEAPDHSVPLQLAIGRPIPEGSLVDEIR
jgi:hypothetical protein